MTADETLAGRLRALRSARNLTQAELAERAGISERAVSDMERGIRRQVYRDTTRRLIGALDLAGADAVEFDALARGRSAAAPPIQGTLPPARTPLVGRRREVGEIVAVLGSDRASVVTIVGTGGVGKTRLAVEVSRRVAPEFAAGVAFLALGELRDPELVVPAIAGALKVHSEGDPAGELAEFLRRRRVLLVLDTFEHLLPAAGRISRLVAGDGAARVLVTSRVPLNLTSERLVEIAPLPEDDAVELFHAFAEAGGRHDLGDEGAVAEICRRVDRLPLAIELAAARTRALGVAEIREHLGRRLPLLGEGAADLPERQRSMGATIAWSYDLLGSGERRLCEQLSVFAGGWTMDAAASVCSAEDSALGMSRLVDSSLVLVEQSEGRRRYRMLDTVREYAADRLLARVGQEGAAGLATGHAHHFAELATAAEAGLRGAGQQEQVELLQVEVDNLRAALEHLLSTHQVAVALRMGGALWMFWRVAGAFSEGRAWLDRLLAQGEAEGADAARAGVLWGAGWLAFHQGAYDQIGRYGEELVELASAQRDASDLRNGLTLKGLERLAAGDLEAAAALFEEALSIVRDAGPPWLLATSCLNRAVPALHTGDLELARRLLLEADTGYRTIGDLRFAARVGLQRTYLALLDHDPARAAETSAGALEDVWRLGDRWGATEQLDGVAAVLAARHDHTGAALIAGAAESAWASLAAIPHPADRALTDKWLQPALLESGDAGEAALNRGRSLALDEAVAEALSRLRR